MDYEKYNNALEKAKVRYNEIKGTDCSEEKFLLDLFPELKESEDERIRKGLIENFKWFCGDYPETTKWGKDDDLLVKDILAWLEKQKSVGEIVERCKNSWYNEGKIAGMAEGLTNDEKYQQGWHDAIEKQGEKKSTWSEEDEKIITALLEGFRYHQLFNPRFGEVPNAEIINWLKSLKERLI